MIDSNRRMWSFPWSYKESIAFVSGTIVIGFLLQLISGKFDLYLLSAPVNLIGGGIMVLLFAAGLGSADTKRFGMYVQEGELEWQLGKISNFTLYIKPIKSYYKMKTGLKFILFAALLIPTACCNNNTPADIDSQEVVKQKRVVTAENARKSTAPISQAIEINGTLYISGQLGVDPATGALVEGGIKEQTEQVLKNIGSILSAAGYTYANVVKSTCFLSDIANFAEMNGVYAGFYSVDPPARSAFAVKDLPMKGALIEIETIAVK